MIRRNALCVGATLGLSLTLPATAQVAPKLPPLTANDFRASRMSGVGFGQLDQGNHPLADYIAMRRLGARQVRVFAVAELEANGEAFSLSQAQLKALDSLVDELEQCGVYLVLVVSFGPAARGPLFKSSALRASALQLWQQLAQRLRGRAVVAGFDIVNEPVPDGLTYGIRQDRWLEFATQVVQAVRAVDPQRVLIIESAPDATPASFSNMRPLPFENLVYSVHSYEPFAFTHQTVMPDFPEARSYPTDEPDGRSSAQALADSLAPVLRFARTHDVPMYVGEFSAVRWAPDDSAARYMADSMALFLRYGWSWSYHEFRAWHGWDAEMNSSLRRAHPRDTDAPVMRALRAALRQSAPAGGRL
jgi:endoglucanase